MLERLIDLSLSPMELTVRALTVYGFVLLLLRISGKKQIGQMGPAEFVAVLLLSNAVQNAMNGGDNSLAGGLILAVVLMSASIAISILTFRSKKISRLLEGEPRLLIHKGRVLQENLALERLSMHELRALARKQGVTSLTEVYSAILEADGSLSLIKKSDLNDAESAA